MWFAGVHSNIGGGYPKEGLAYVSLYWMMLQAKASGLRFVRNALDEAHDHANAHAKLYESRSGLAVFYRYQPRDIADLCRPGQAKVHVTAMDRIRWGTEGYAPTRLPETFEVVDPDADTKPGVRRRVEEYQAYVKASVDARRSGRDHAVALSRQRTHLYYGLLLSTGLFLLTLAASLWELESVGGMIAALSLALRPLLGWANPWVTWIVTNARSVASATVGIVIPGFMDAFLQSLAATPEIATLFVLIGGALFWRQRVLIRRLREHGETMWRGVFDVAALP